MKLVFGGIPILTKTGQDGCKPATYNLPLNMGSLTIQGISCPVAAGSAVKIPAVAAIGKFAPNGKLISTVSVKQGSTDLFSAEVDVTLP